MSVESHSNGNGYIRWRDLTETERRLREEAHGNLSKFEQSVKERLDKAHVYHTDLASTQTSAITGLDLRVDKLESILDQQRGARNLAFFLIGSNVLLVIVSVLSILHGLNIV